MKNIFLTIVFFLFKIHIVLATPMQGDYIVDQSGKGDFTSIKEAINTLVKRGVDSPTRILLNDGIYNEQITIPAIPGAKKGADITFCAKSEDYSKVVIEYLTNNPYNWVVDLNNTSYITIRDITIKTLSKDYAGVIVIRNGSNNITMQSNKLIGADEVLKNQDNKSIVRTKSNNLNQSDHNISFTDNILVNGSNGIYLFTDDKLYANKILIKDNTFINQCKSAIKINRGDDITCDGNHIKSVKSINFGINISESHRINIQNNIINVCKNTDYLSSMNFFYGICIDRQPYNSDTTLVYNNSISIKNSSSEVDNFAIMLSNVKKCKVIHNSISLKSSSKFESCISLYSCKVIDIHNNIFINAGIGSIYNYKWTTKINSNNNNLYSDKGSYSLTDWSITSQSFEDWKRLFKCDENSTSVDPLFENDSILILSKQSPESLKKGKNLNKYSPIDINGAVRSSIPWLGINERISVVTKLNQNPTNMPYSIWPNPSSSIIHIDIGSVVLYNIDFFIIDLSGRIIKTISYSKINGTININVSDIKRGIYFIGHSHMKNSLKKIYIK